MSRRGPRGLLGGLGSLLSPRGAGRSGPSPSRLLGGCGSLVGLGLVVLGLLAALGSCGGPGSGDLPSEAGRYPLKERSVTFDGDRYSFLWADPSGNLQRATTRDVKLQLDEQNLLEVTPTGEAILHLRQDEPVEVEARDKQGDFGSFWYPFLVGQVLGGGPVVVNQPPREYRDPVYRYPPTDRLERGDTLTGNRASSEPRTPDYEDLAPVGGAVSGQSGGAGGGQAATNRAAATAVVSGQSGGSGGGQAAINRAASPAAVSGQAGGAGGGSAALNKSGAFKSGEKGYASKVDSGALKPISGRTEPRVGAGSGALSGGGAATSKPKISTGRGTAPSPRVSTPAKSSGSTPRISTKPRG